MALQGTLDTFALADLVRLMATTTKTGELAIEADGTGTSGCLWFVDGDLVGGEPTGSGGAEGALFALLRLEQGTFSFQPGTIPDGIGDDEGDHHDAIEVLAAAEARLEAWRPIEALVPHPDVVVGLVQELSEDEVTLTRERWRQVLVVAPGVTARDFARALDLDEVAAATAIKDLADRGLVEVDAGAADPSPDEEPGPEREADPVLLGTGLPEAEPDPFVAEPVTSPPWGHVAEDGDGPGVVGEQPLQRGLSEPGGSMAVDLDSVLGASPFDHHYLGGEASILPEVLPDAASMPFSSPDQVAPSPVDADPDAEDPVPAADPSQAEPDLALQLEALSPAAARAVAAAAATPSAAGNAADDDGHEDDAGRRVLRRIINSGRS